MHKIDYMLSILTTIKKEKKVKGRKMEKKKMRPRLWLEQLEV